MNKRVDIEVEVGGGLTFEIVEEVDGFWVGYDPKVFEGWEPSRNDLEWVIQAIKRVMKELDIQPPFFALDLVPFWGLGSSNPTCLVNKRKDTVYLRLPIEVVNGQLAISVGLEIHDNYVFYHELMHAKDVLEGRFPSAGFIMPDENPELLLVMSLSHFSIEGRLEMNGLPHKDQQNVVEDEYSWMSNLSFPVARSFFQKACGTLWGKEVTFQDLQSYVHTTLKAMKKG